MLYLAHPNSLIQAISGKGYFPRWFPTMEKAILKIINFLFACRSSGEVETHVMPIQKFYTHYMVVGEVFVWSVQSNSSATGPYR